MAFLVDKEYQGTINGCAQGTISLREILEYVEEKSDGKIILSEEGDLAPYNGQVEYSINVQKAEALGYEFKYVRDWIYELLDSYILSM